MSTVGSISCIHGRLASELLMLKDSGLPLCTTKRRSFGFPIFCRAPSSGMARFSAKATLLSLSARLPAIDADIA